MTIVEELRAENDLLRKSLAINADIMAAQERNFGIEKNCRLKEKQVFLSMIDRRDDAIKNLKKFVEVMNNVQIL
jgi:hypothetical protein